MKAESIEQIREHLAKGGRVLALIKGASYVRRIFTASCGDPVTLSTGEWIELENDQVCSFKENHWQLLPLEEKEPEPCPGCGRHEPYCDCPPGMYDKKAPEPVTVTSDKIEAAGRLVKFIREHSSGQCRILSIGSACECPLCDVGRLLEEKEPVDHGTQKGQAKDGRDPMPCELNREAYLDLLREDFDWLVEQPRSLEREHIKEVLSWLMKNRPDGTQKVQEEIYVVGPHDGTPEQQAVRQRIRTRLLHGMWPEMSDLMAWWEATTGERIEWGKRCERCKASGRVKRLLPIGYDWITCLDCNGSGYSVRPTWMNQ